MSTNRPTFRFPFALHGQPQEVQQAHIFAFQGIQDCQQGIAAIKAQLDAKTSTSTSGTASATNTSTVSETVNVVTGANVGLVNNQSGWTAYTTSQTDYGAFIILSDASPIAVTLSTTASAPSVIVPWYCTFINLGTGTATLTPISGTINVNTVLPGNALTIAFDGTNFWAEPMVPVPESITAVAHEWLASYNAATGLFTQSQPAYTDISGTPQLAQTITATSHEWLVSFNATTGLFTATQPAFSDISGTPSTTQVPVQSLTTTGTGAATLSAGVLNVPTPTIPAAPFTGTSGSLGGSVMTVGQTVKVTVAITGATTAMVAVCSPVTYPGDGFVFYAYVSAPNTVTVCLTCVLAGTPASSIYNVRLLQ